MSSQTNTAITVKNTHIRAVDDKTGLLSTRICPHVPFVCHTDNMQEAGFHHTGGGSLVSVNSASLTYIGKREKLFAALSAWANRADEYPSINISLIHRDGTEDHICFAEYNNNKPEGKEVHVGAYARKFEEPVNYDSFN